MIWSPEQVDPVDLVDHDNQCLDQQNNEYVDQCVDLVDRVDLVDPWRHQYTDEVVDPAIVDNAMSVLSTMSVHVDNVGPCRHQ